MASLLALVKRKSRQRFLQTPGKTNFNNVTALFSLFYFPEMLVGGGGGGIGEQKRSGLVPVQWNHRMWLNPMANLLEIKFPTLEMYYHQPLIALHLA